MFDYTFQWATGLPALPQMLDGALVTLPDRRCCRW
jgi:hypothetical protein